MVKTTYPKTVTEKIVEYWALGFSAEETRQALYDKQQVKVCLNTVYKHRHSLTAQDLIDELIRRQERAITKADAENPALAMKYRDKLLEKLMPQRFEAHTLEEVRVEEKHVNITANLTQYDTAIEEELNRVLRTNRAKQPVDTPKP